MSSKKETALVISGGGSKGAFAAGVIKYLYNQYRKTGWFSIIGGSSVGALISPFAALMGAHRKIGDEALSTMIETFTSITTDDVLEKRHFIKRIRRSGYLNESDPMEELIESRLKPEWYEWLESKKAPYCYVVYTNFRTGEKSIASPQDPEIGRSDFIKAMRASASVPIYMEATNVNGELCYDGGLRDPLPTEEAIEKGAEVLVPILLTLPEFREKTGDFDSLKKVLTRSLGILIDECKYNDMQYAELICSANLLKREIEKEVSGDDEVLKKLRGVFEKEKYENLFGGNKNLLKIVRGLHPDSNLSGDILSFEPEKMKKWLKKGEKKAGETVDRTPFN